MPKKERKTPNRTRKNAIQIMLNDADLATIDAQVKQESNRLHLDVSRSAYATRALLNYERLRGYEEQLGKLAQSTDELYTTSQNELARAILGNT